MMRRLWADRGRVLKTLLRRTAQVVAVLIMFALLVVPVWLVFSLETAVLVFVLAILAVAYNEVRSRRGKPTRASTTDGWRVFTVYAAVLALVGTAHPYLALSVSLLNLLLPVRRGWCVDLGRFTLTAWAANPDSNPERPLFALAWMWHNEKGVPTKRSGVQVGIGRSGIGVFALMPRSEWPGYKQTRDAQRRARQMEREVVSPRRRIQRRSAPRCLSVGPFRMWVARVPQGPAFGYGPIATTDTPSNPAPGQQVMNDANGRVLVLGGIAFAALRCRSVPVPVRPS